MVTQRQALLAQQLLHAPPAEPVDPAQATDAQRDHAFADAVAQALLRAGEYERAVLALPASGAMAVAGQVRPSTLGHDNSTPDLVYISEFPPPLDLHTHTHTHTHLSDLTCHAHIKNHSCTHFM